MGTLVSYQLEGSIATITMDDGKVNALSVQMLTELGAALDRATADRAVVVLTGRDGLFSAGFDLAVLRGGGSDASGMLRAGFELAERKYGWNRHAALITATVLDRDSTAVPDRGATQRRAGENTREMTERLQLQPLDSAGRLGNPH